MTRRVIFPLQDSLLLCVIKKMIDFEVNSCLYVHLPPLWKRGKNIFLWRVCALGTAGLGLGTWGDFATGLSCKRGKVK